MRKVLFLFTLLILIGSSSCRKNKKHLGSDDIEYLVTSDKPSLVIGYVDENGEFVGPEIIESRLFYKTIRKPQSDSIGIAVAGYEFNQRIIVKIMKDRYTLAYKDSTGPLPIVLLSYEFFD